jgi:hypothetical protein
MKLEDFITSTLKDVINGVKGAQKHAEECGGAINPKGLQYLTGSSGTIQHKETSRIGTDIEFDIEVLVTKQKGSKGKLSVSIPTVVDAGVGGQSGTENRSINRVKFKVPVIFPKGEYSEQ